MVRRTRIVATAATVVGILAGAALAPAAGDRHATGGASAERVSFNDDGVPFVNGGPQCRAGGEKLKHGRDADPSDY